MTKDNSYLTEINPPQDPLSSRSSVNESFPWNDKTIADDIGFVIISITPLLVSLCAMWVIGTGDDPQRWVLAAIPLTSAGGTAAVATQQFGARTQKKD